MPRSVNCSMWRDDTVKSPGDAGNIYTSDFQTTQGVQELIVGHFGHMDLDF